MKHEKKNKKFGGIWAPNKAGILVSGRVWEASNRASMNLLQVAGRGDEIANLYKESQVDMSPKCDLAKLIANAQSVVQVALIKGYGAITSEQRFRLLHLDRVASAVLPLKDVTNRAEYLKKLVSGTLNLFNNEPSLSKDILWELELWAGMRKRHAATELLDPPDIVLNLTGGRLAIACKRIYSERNLEKNLSEAVKQVEGEYDVGVVAMNVDSLIPPNTFLPARTERAMGKKLQSMNADFLKRHERYLAKYLRQGRLVCALSVINAIVHVEEWRVQLNTAMQATVWTIPGLQEKKAALLEEFRLAVLV